MGAGLQHSDADIARTLAATAMANSNSWLAAPESDEGGPLCEDNPESFRDKPELRNYIPTHHDVVADQEVSQFSDEITVNCAPLV